MLRIERTANGQVVFTLSGRIQSEDVEQFRQLLAAEAPRQQLMFDLRDITLVNQDAVVFLVDCEAQGIKLDRPYTKAPQLGIAIAFIKDPWGTNIELTEGLVDIK